MKLDWFVKQEMQENSDFHLHIFVQMKIQGQEE